MSGRDVTAELAEALRAARSALVTALNFADWYAEDCADRGDDDEEERALRMAREFGAAWDAARAALARYDAERASEKPWWHGKTCFACGKKFTGKVPPTLVDTRDDQTVLVGPECAKRVMAAGEEGYRYPGPGPRLYPITAALCPICGEEPVCDGCAGRCVRCARLSRECC